MQSFELKKRQILDRVELFDVVSERVKLRRAGRRWVGLCPFHSEKTPSFTVTPEQGFFKCFGCGKGGDVFTFIEYIENVSFPEAMRILADRAGIELGRSTTGGVRSGTSRADVAKVNDWAAGFFRRAFTDGTIGAEARAYVEKRGFTPEIVERFQLGLANIRGPGLAKEAARAGFGESLLIEADLLRRGERGDAYETFRDRLMFPIRDATNRVIGFGGRTLVDDKAKYINTRQNALFDKGRNLYGIEVARSSIIERQRALVVEGYTDCMACHQAGLAEAVATCGTALTDSQVSLLRRYCEEVVLLFDSDSAGEAAADRAIRVALPACLRVRLARVPEGKDPCELLILQGVNAFSDVLKRAGDALEFKWLATRQRVGEDGSAAKKREAVLDFLRVVSEGVKSQAVDEIQRGLILNEVAHVLKIEPAEVRRLMDRLEPRRRTVAAAPRQSPAKDDALDGEQSAWVHVLEVALNEPAMLSLFEGEPQVSRIQDERDRRIAMALTAAAAELGDFRMADVLARLRDGQDSQRAGELARRGAERGNFEGTMRVALERIQRALQFEGYEKSRRRLLDVAQEDSNALMAATMKEHRHFAPRRMIRSAVRGPEIPGETLAHNVAQETRVELP